MGFANGITPPHVVADPQPFDAYDDDLMHDVLGNERLSRPVQTLLMTYLEVMRVQGSFGTLDKARFFERVLPELRSLYQACKEEWIESL